MVDDDKNLDNFSIEEDKKNNLIPMILQAKATSKEGFKIIASPWTSPPWMKIIKNGLVENYCQNTEILGLCIFQIY